MGRKRKAENAGLPQYVYFKRGWWVLREYDRKIKRIKGSEIHLCKIGSSKSEIWRAWESVKGIETGQFSDLAYKYQKSPQFIDLAKKYPKKLPLVSQPDNHHEDICRRNVWRSSGISNHPCYYSSIYGLSL